MDNSFLDQVKERLEKEKISATEELQRFATKDKKLNGDWDTNFPTYAKSESGSAALESAADEVEEYGNRLPIEHSLEIKLRDIEKALEKIKKGNYGLCENCVKPILKERLEIYPEARFCLNCNNK